MTAGRIFIVDDNAHNLTLLTNLLREAGHDVRMANSGRRALAAVALHPPELILLDISMPEMDGYAVCAALKDDARTRDIPVIFLSALDDVQDKVSAFRAGGVDYVTKPFQAPEVLARVEAQLELARARASLVEKNAELARKNDELERAWHAADDLFSTLTDLLPGTTIADRYRLEAKIGAGGFAAVYRSVSLSDGQEVAVKILRHRPGRSEEQRRRFELEGASILRVRHRNAVVVRDWGITDAGIAYLAMELLEGRSLADELGERSKLDLPRALEVLAPVCDVLSEAHAAGVIHRDVKPANIFLHRGSDGEEIVKVVDFGIAKLTDDGATADATTLGRVLGTPMYMSPERLLGQPFDGRADVYSVAVVLYEALAGRLPILPRDEGLGATIMAMVNEPPQPLGRVAPDIPPAIDDLVMRGLARRREDRPSAKEFAARLREPGRSVVSAETRDVRAPR